MNRLNQIWEREIVRFIFVGGLNTVLGFIYYNILLLFLTYGYAVTVGYVFGITTSYLLNSWLVFRHPPKWSKLLQYPAVYIVQYLVSLVLIFIAVEYFSIGERLAYLVAIALTIPLTFTMSRFIIVSEKTED